VTTLGVLKITIPKAISFKTKSAVYCNFLENDLVFNFEMMKIIKEIKYNPHTIRTIALTERPKFLS
jgi:hypothetical protein